MTDFEKVLTCDICGEDIEVKRDPGGNAYWNKGHNAEPIVDGRACDFCNMSAVIPARLREIRGNK